MGAKAKPKPKPRAKPKAKPKVAAVDDDEANQSSSESSSSSSDSDSSSESEKNDEEANSTEVPSEAESECSECSADEVFDDLSSQSSSSDERPLDKSDENYELFKMAQDAGIPIWSDLPATQASSPPEDSEEDIWQSFYRFGDSPEDVARAIQELENRMRPPPEPIYQESLATLPPPFTEKEFLWCLGDFYATDYWLQLHQIPVRHRVALLSKWEARRYDTGTLRLPYLPAVQGDVTIKDDLTKVVPANRTRLKRMAPMPSLQKNGKPLTRQQQYRDTVLFIIEEVIQMGNQLGITPFTDAPDGASVMEIANIYGYSITSKSKGGILAIRSLRTRWNRLRRYMDAATDVGELSVAFTCQFIDTTRLTGFAATLRWGAEATGLDILQSIAATPAVAKRQPKRGWSSESPTRATKQAPWVCDLFIVFLARLCHHARPDVRARAFFFYALAIGGVRFADAQHVIKIEVLGDAILFTASRFKCTKGDTLEVFAIPLKDINGHSLLPAVQALRNQMGEGYILAYPEESGDYFSGRATPARACTYSAAIALLRRLSHDFVRSLPADSQYHRDNYTLITMHSLRAWLATFLRQLNVPAEQINELLHWSQGTMQRLYNRNLVALEVNMRTRVVQILGGPWQSAGPGHPLMTNLPLWVINQDPTHRF